MQSITFGIELTRHRRRHLPLSIIACQHITDFSFFNLKFDLIEMDYKFKNIFVKCMEFPVVSVTPEDGHLSWKHAGFYDYLNIKNFHTFIGILY